MKHKQLKHGVPVFIDWIDSMSLGGWVGDISQCEVGRCESLGFVVKSDLLGLTITTSFFNYKKLDEKCNDPITIPWVAITQLQILNIKFKPRKKL